MITINTQEELEALIVNNKIDIDDDTDYQALDFFLGEEEFINN